MWCFKGRITINFVTEKCLFPKSSACSFYTRAPDQIQLFLPFNKTNEDSYCSLQGNGWGTAWFSAETLPAQEHTSPPSLWQRWLIAASKLKLSLEISSVCPTTLPLFLHPSPSKPSLCLLPPLTHTPTACFSIWRSLQDSWMQHVVSLRSTTEASSHETKGNLAKLGKFLFWKEHMFIQKSWILFNLILTVTRENNEQWLFCWWCCWCFFFSFYITKLASGTCNYFYLQPAWYKVIQLNKSLWLLADGFQTKLQC